MNLSNFNAEIARKASNKVISSKITNELLIILSLIAKACDKGKYELQLKEASDLIIKQLKNRGFKTEKRWVCTGYRDEGYYTYIISW